MYFMDTLALIETGVISILFVLCCTVGLFVLEGDLYGNERFERQKKNQHKCNLFL